MLSKKSKIKIIGLLMLLLPSTIGLAAQTDGESTGGPTTAPTIVADNEDTNTDNNSEDKKETSTTDNSTSEDKKETSTTTNNGTSGDKEETSTTSPSGDKEKTPSNNDNEGKGTTPTCCLKTKGGIASAVAIANIPQVSADKLFSIGVGGSYYNRHGALAIGISGQNKKRSIIYKVTGGTDFTSTFTIGAGINYSFGQIDTSYSVDEFEKLKKDNEQLKKDVKELKIMVKMLMNQIK